MFELRDLEESWGKGHGEIEYTFMIIIFNFLLHIYIYMLS